MGKPRGFLDIKFKGEKYRSVDERLKDFNEVEVLLTDDEIHQQANSVHYRSEWRWQNHAG